MLRVVSLPLGALRLAELRPLGDPPGPAALARLTRHVRSTLEEAVAAIAAFAPRHAYGSSGSIHALAHVLRHLDGGPPLRHVNGRRLERKSLERVTRQLEAMSLAERVSLPGLDAARHLILMQRA
jgi:exopolyphosphatase/pppGpp-phosphohydrolase